MTTNPSLFILPIAFLVTWNHQLQSLWVRVTASHSAQERFFTITVTGTVRQMVRLNWWDFFGSVPVHLPSIHLLPSPRHCPHPLILFRSQLRLSTSLLGTLPSLSPLFFLKRFLVQHTNFVSFGSSYVLYHYSKGPQQAHQNTHEKLVGLDLSL